ncbi:MAG: response regulator [Acidobacteriota bacterium]
MIPPEGPADGPGPVPPVGLPGVDAESPATILIAEDDDGVRRFAATYLGRLGYRILEAVDGRDALRVAEDYSGTIHLLLTDVVMPNVNGPELARLLLEVRPETRLLFMSGYVGDGKVFPLSLVGSAPLLQKPFRPAVLAEEVRSLLGHGSSDG